MLGTFFMVSESFLSKEGFYLKQISGNKLLVKALKEEGVETLFGYPGACTIDISDELYRQNGIDIILPRHEQALVHEADAYARTTGKVGVCLVTSGPGATNLVIHTFAVEQQFFDAVNHVGKYTFDDTTGIRRIVFRHVFGKLCQDQTSRRLPHGRTTCLHSGLSCCWF